MSFVLDQHRISLMWIWDVPTLSYHAWDGSLTAGTVTIGTVRTTSALTAAAPTAATVGASSAQAVAANANRRGLVLTNLSTNMISFGLATTAVLNSGITLYPGGIWQMDETTFSLAAINAIASAASSPISVQEFS
jgi:hypothetical protein